MGYKLEVGVACPLNKIPSSTGEDIIQNSHLSEESESESVYVCMWERGREWECVCVRERENKKEAHSER